MATILSRITNDIRPTLDDEVKSRWTDNQLFVFYRQAVERLNNMGSRLGLPLMRKKFEFTLPPETESYPVPDDYKFAYGLWRTDVPARVTHMPLDDWESLVNVGNGTYFIVEDGDIYIKGAAGFEMGFRLRYYYDIGVDSLLITSQSPWNGKLDYPISEYVRVRALNVDRFNTSPDQGLLADMEKQVIDSLFDEDPDSAEMNGAFFYGIR